MVEGRYKVEGIQFIINSAAVSDRYRVSTYTQSPGIGYRYRANAGLKVKKNPEPETFLEGGV